MDRVLLVTCASRGIGAATARLAAAQGWAVAVNYTAHSLAADEVVRAIRAAGGQEGDLVVAAAYFPDGRQYEDGSYRGRNDCRVISTYPWEIIRDLLYTLHVEVPAEDRAPMNQSLSAPDIDKPINESSVIQLI